MLPTFRYKVGVVAQFLDYIEAGGECGGTTRVLEVPLVSSLLSVLAA